MKEEILHLLKELRAYALSKNATVSISYHEEDSHLMRFANSAISLNTNEHLIRLGFTAYQGRRRASYEMITSMDQLDEMKRALDKVIAMVPHAQPLTYDPTLPVFPETYSDERGYDEGLANITNEERLRYFNTVAGSLETDELKLSGIFSSGTNIQAQINTLGEHTQYFCFTDCQITAVMANSRLKWEVSAEQSAQKKADLTPEALNRRLALLADLYQKGKPEQLPLGKYDIVLGSAAIATWLEYMGYIGFDGGSMKRGETFLTEEDLEKKKLSPQFTLTDDPAQLGTFPFTRDFQGIERKPYPIFEHGVFKGFTWSQDDADEFGAAATGHSVPHFSLAVAPGTKPINSLEDLLAMPRDHDILYIPYIHYVGVVNPTEGMLTGSSRFGALLLKADGTVAIPYNVRLTHSLLTFFGDGIEWISSETIPYNLSLSYDARNPVAIVVPRCMRINGLEISHSNSSY